MPVRLEVPLGMPLVGGRIVEGFANGFTLVDLTYMLRQEPLHLDTLKGYASLTYDSLGIHATKQAGEPKKYLMQAGNRAIGMCIVAGLMQRRDVKRPTRPFIFTMKPEPSCAIQYYSTFDATKSRAHVWPVLPAVAARVPNGPPRLNRRRNDHHFELSAHERTYMGAVLLGMSNTEIADKKVSDAERHQMKYACKQTGFKTVAQLSAYCAVNGLIGVPEEVLHQEHQDIKPVEPIRYERSVLLELPVLSHDIARPA